MSDPRRDQYSRYLIATPEGDTAHTRVTTVADTLDDRFHLERWQQRNVALGLAKRPDLLALAQSSTADDKETLNRVCKEAIDAVAAGARANTGTALHRWMERVDAGEEFDIPPPHHADVRAYRECLDAHGIEINPEWLEVIAVCSSLPEPVAGTIDRIVGWRDRLVIGDVKSGRSMDFAWRKTAQQLAIYSRADHLYDTETEQLRPMPEVDRDHAIVFHVPAGTATCTPYLVDLNAGWQAAQTACWVRQWRKRDDLATEIAA